MLKIIPMNGCMGTSLKASVLSALECRAPSSANFFIDSGSSGMMLVIVDTDRFKDESFLPWIFPCGYTYGVCAEKNKQKMDRTEMGQLKNQETISGSLTGG